MKFKELTLLSLLFVFLCNNAIACPAIFGGHNLSVKEGRMSYAKDLAKHFCFMEESVPNLRPADKEWLETELGSTDYDRHYGAKASIEYAQKTAKEDLQTLCNHLTILESGLHENVSDRNGAALEWIIVSRLLNSDEFNWRLRITYQESLLKFHPDTDEIAKNALLNGKGDRYCHFQNENVIDALWFLLSMP